VQRVSIFTRTVHQPMEKERLFNLFNQYYPLSDALKEYMSRVLKKENAVKGQHLIRAGQIPAECWFIIKGSARAYIDTPDRKTTIWYWHPDEMMYVHSGFCSKTVTSENIELLEDSTLFSLSYNAIPKLIRLFPAFYKIEFALKELHQQELLEQNIDLKKLNAEERFVKLFGRFPALMNTSFQKDIASYLGMSPDTLSRLRGKK